MNKELARKARAAIPFLHHASESYQMKYYHGCCHALGQLPLSWRDEQLFSRFFEDNDRMNDYWWGDPRAENYTARVIALELFALACESGDV
jgi:hypothetical protein